VAYGVKSAAALPIKSGTRILAVITLTSREPDHFNSDRTRLLTAIANGLGGLLENASLREEARQQATEIKIIGEVARIITSTLTIDQVYEQFATEMKRLVPFDRVNINVINPASGRFTIRYLLGQEVAGRQVGAVLPMAGTLTGQAAATGTTVIRDDIATGPPRSGDPEYLQVGLRSSITVPLVSKEKLRGSLTLRSRRLAAFGPREQRVLEGLASQIAPAVENSLLYEELQARMEEKAVVDEVARIVTSTLDIDQVYEQFAVQMKRLLDFERATLNLVGRDKKTYQVRYLFGTDYPGLPARVVRPLAEGTCTHYVVTTGKALCRADLAKEPTFPDDSQFINAGLRSLVAVLLVSKDVVIGCLILRGRGVSTYGPREQRILEGLAAQIAPAVENSLLFEDVRRLALAVEAIDDAVAFLDPKGHVQFINRAAEEMSGYGAAEVQGKPIILIAPAGPGSRARGREMLWQAAQGGWRGEARAVRKGGEELILNLSMAPVRDQQGSVIGIIGVAQDITERKRMEERIQETSRLISLGELAAGMAHEINNPLTVVAGFSQLLMSQDLPQPVRDDLEKIYAEAQRAARIVQNLLSFSRKGEPEKRYLDVTTVLDRALAMKEHDFRVNNIQVTCHWSRDLPRTMVDEHQLIQAVLNTLANAQQAMAEAQGGGELVLRASHLRDRRSTRLKDRIRISITDNGPGILPEHLPRIFDPFFTTKGVGKGTGLGLSISYGIVQQHDGDLWAENLPGKGATFHLELPVLGPAEEAAPPATDLTQTSANPQHILVVDDEPAIRDLLAKALATEGHEVDLAEDGEEAWRKVQGQTYGCILLDLKMPRMNGQQLYHRIAETDQKLARQVIFMTGDTASPDTRDFISASGNPVVSKPLNIAELRQQILKYLEATDDSQ
jgi:two-component system NtrC family sensor kinase